MSGWVQVSERTMADILARLAHESDKAHGDFARVRFYVDHLRRMLAKVEYDDRNNPTGFFVREVFLQPKKPRIRRLGFSGTRASMTPEQLRTVVQLIADYGPEELHHGDAIGADAQFATIPGNFRRIAYPSDRPSQRAYCPADEVKTPKPPLTRNRHIVDASDGIIAAPAEAEEQQRGGTWSTIRFARSRGKLLAIVLPDGTVVKG